MPPSCLICERTSTTPQVSAIRPRAAEDEDLVVRDGSAGWWDAHVLALVCPGDRVAADDLVPLLDEILDGDVKVGVGPVESGEHLLDRFGPCRFKRQWRADQRVGLDELVDGLGDELRVASVAGVTEASHRRLVACFLCC